MITEGLSFDEKMKDMDTSFKNSDDNHSNFEY